MSSWSYLSEILDSESGRHDDQFKGVPLGLSLGHNPRQEADENVGEDGPLVSLVDDYRRVLGQQKVTFDLA